MFSERDGSHLLNHFVMLACFVLALCVTPNIYVSKLVNDKTFVIV